MSKGKWTDKAFEYLKVLAETECTWDEIADIIKAETGLDKAPEAVRKFYSRHGGKRDYDSREKLPRVLLFDIETTPLEAYTWTLYPDNIGLNMVKEDWSVLSYSAKFLGEDKIHYRDVRNKRNKRHDKEVLEEIWELLNQADIVVGHNSDAFDVKKLNARFILNGMQPPSSYKRLDTKKLAKKHFNFTSNRLAYLTDKLCETYQKLSHAKFPGFSLWEHCLKGNLDAFKEMEEYNKYDVLSLEELFMKLLPWENAGLFSIYGEDLEPTCTCGSTEFKKNGFYYTAASKFQKHKCKNCGAEYRDSENLANKKRAKMKGTVR